MVGVTTQGLPRTPCAHTPEHTPAAHTGTRQGTRRAHRGTEQEGGINSFVILSHLNSVLESTHNLRPGILTIDVEQLRNNNGNEPLNIFHITREIISDLVDIFRCIICTDSLGESPRLMLCCGRHICTPCVVRWCNDCRDLRAGNYTCIYCGTQRVSYMIALRRVSFRSSQTAVMILLFRHFSRFL